MMFCDPMNPISPSTTRILRWLQVGSLVPAAERLHGQHELPAHAHAVEPLERLAVLLHAQRGDVVGGAPAPRRRGRPHHRARRRTARSVQSYAKM